MINIKPITYSFTYGEDCIDDYIWKCEQGGTFPTQAGYNEYAEDCFLCMLEESVKMSTFDRSVTAE